MDGTGRCQANMWDVYLIGFVYSGPIINVVGPTPDRPNKA